MANDDAALSARVRWARLRFQILGPLMAAPAEDGELKTRIDELAARAWRHPTTGESVAGSQPHGASSGAVSQDHGASPFAG